MRESRRKSPRKYEYKHMNKRTDIWIGIIALIIICGLGMWWLFANSQMEMLSLDMAATSTRATTTAPSVHIAASKGTSVQKPIPVDRSSQSVVAIAENLTGASLFASMLSNTNVASALMGPGPFTIFVPTNAAFSQLPQGSISGLSSSAKLRFIKYHIIVGRAVDPSAQLSGTIQAFSGDALNFSLGTDNIPLVNSAIVVSTYKAKNGVVYLIDNVLIPPTLNR